MNAPQAASVGGGAINEKSRTFDSNAEDKELPHVPNIEQRKGFQPQIHKAHLWHALEGLDRYPNYFQRWSNIRAIEQSDQEEEEVDDLLKLEQVLRDTADSVRRERERILRQRTSWADKIPQFLQQYPHFSKFWKAAPYEEEDWKSWCEEILHPTVSELLFAANANHTNATTGGVYLKACPQATVTQVLSGNVPVEWNVSLLTQLLDEECPDVFAMPILSDTFCRELIQLIRALRQFLAQDDSIVPPRFFSLSELGITWLDALLFRVLIQPITKHLYEKTHLDWFHSFVAGYAAQPSRVTPRQFLVPHTDDSEVTLNLCLGEKDFQGGLLEFGPMRGHTGSIQTDTVQPRIGYGLLHVGRLMHQVTPITSGDRYAYIIWTRSWTDTRAKQCPCCWLNHRTGPAACICGLKWN